VKAPKCEAEVVKNLFEEKQEFPRRKGKPERGTILQSGISLGKTLEPIRDGRRRMRVTETRRIKICQKLRGIICVEVETQRTDKSKGLHDRMFSGHMNGGKDRWHRLR